MPVPNCTDCSWCPHPPMPGSTDPEWHINIPNPGCITNPKPGGGWPPLPPPCTCTRDPITGLWTHDPNCQRHQ